MSKKGYPSSVPVIKPDSKVYYTDVTLLLDGKIKRGYTEGRNRRDGRPVWICGPIQDGILKDLTETKFMYPHDNFRVFNWQGNHIETLSNFEHEPKRKRAQKKEDEKDHEERKEQKKRERADTNVEKEGKEEVEEKEEMKEEVEEKEGKEEVEEKEEMKEEVELVRRLCVKKSKYEKLLYDIRQTVWEDKQIDSDKLEGTDALVFRALCCAPPEYLKSIRDVFTTLTQ